MEVAIADSIRDRHLYTGDICTQWEAELDLSIYQFQGDEIMHFIIASIVQQESIPFLGCKPVKTKTMPYIKSLHS